MGKVICEWSSPHQRRAQGAACWYRFFEKVQAFICIWLAKKFLFSSGPRGFREKKLQNWDSMNQRNRMKTWVHLFCIIHIVIDCYHRTSYVIDHYRGHQKYRWCLIKNNTKFYATWDHGKASRKELFLINLSEHPYILKSIGNYCWNTNFGNVVSSWKEKLWH